jgi:hypothetical protein
MLKSVNVSDILLTNTGKFLKCAVALQFEEYANEANATTTSSTSKSDALSATASSADRSAMKPT